MSTRRAFESALRPTSSPLELSDNHTVSELTEERDRTGAFGIQRLPRGLSKGLTDEVCSNRRYSVFAQYLFVPSAPLASYVHDSGSCLHDRRPFRFWCALRGILNPQRTGESARYCRRSMVSPLAWQEMAMFFR